MAMACTGSEQKVPTLFIPAEGRGDGGKEAVPSAHVKKRLKPGRKLNGVVKGDTRSMYISPGKFHKSCKEFWSGVLSAKAAGD